MDFFNYIFFLNFIYNSIRGRLGSLLMLSANSGFLFGFLAGYYLTYFTIPYFGIILSIVYLVAFTFFPETPSYLLRCKKEEVMRKFNVSVNLICIFKKKEIIFTFSQLNILFDSIEMLSKMKRCQKMLPKNGMSFESGQKKR